MAKKRAQTVASPSEETVRARIVVDVPDGTPSYYANFVEVANNQWDFSLIVARMPAKHTVSQIAEMKETETLTLAAEMTLTIPTTLVAGLIRALSDQKAKFEAATGVSLEEKNSDGSNRSNEP